VIVGAELVDERIHDFLSAIMPGYSELKGNHDITFSVRISMARALRLCPSEIFDAVDKVRDIRNKFAHGLEHYTLDTANHGFRNKIISQLNVFQLPWNEQQVTSDLFGRLLMYIIIMLDLYKAVVSELNEFIRSNNIGQALDEFVSTRTGATGRRVYVSNTVFDKEAASITWDEGP